MLLSQNDGYFMMLLKGDNSHLPAGKHGSENKTVMPCSARKFTETLERFPTQSREQFQVFFSHAKQTALPKSIQGI